MTEYEWGLDCSQDVGPGDLPLDEVDLVGRSIVDLFPVFLDSEGMVSTTADPEGVSQCLVAAFLDAEGVAQCQLGTVFLDAEGVVPVLLNSGKGY